MLNFSTLVSQISNLIFFSLLLSSSNAQDCITGSSVCTNNRVLASCRNSEWVLYTCPTGYRCINSNPAQCVPSRNQLQVQNPLFDPAPVIAISNISARQQNTQANDTPTSSSAQSSQNRATSTTSAESSSQSSSAQPATSNRQTSSSPPPSSTSASPSSSSSSSQEPSTKDSSSSKTTQESSSTSESPSEQTTTSEQATTSEQTTTSSDDKDSCNASFVPTCKDLSNIINCVDGKISAQNCSSNQVCVSGGGSDSAKCIDLPPGSQSCTQQGVMRCFGTNSYQQCDGKQYQYMGTCANGQQCFINNQQVAGCTSDSSNASTMTIPAQKPYVPNSALKTAPSVVFSLIIVQIFILISRVFVF
ncbi:hypothetical protein BB560_004212 [Smittium megazygosporum]|uniref:Carbohydrate-binding module family 19 domain-containing protein n=1 Tax=Smittium megazygosporum TaxID=133381 RepID=A0A2T9Z9T2_9FUNG|nr:hypothetical protein BB560_004212 [Smittium megazygosporum]